MRNEKLITAREEREWTQEKAAEKIGVSRVTYARWEEKGVIPHLSTLGMACAAFKMTSDTLRAWLAAEEAEVQADRAAQETMSNTRACFKALERAEMFAGQIGSEEDTFGMYFDVSRIPAYRGSCHIRLHQPQEALVALEEILEPLEPSGALDTGSAVRSCRGEHSSHGY